MRHISSRRTLYSTELWVKLLPAECTQSICIGYSSSYEWLWSVLNPTHLIFVYLIRFELGRTMYQRLFLFRIFILHRTTQGSAVWNLDYPDDVVLHSRTGMQAWVVSTPVIVGDLTFGPSHWCDRAKPHLPPMQTSRAWDGRRPPNYSSKDKGREGRLYTCCLLSLELPIPSQSFWLSPYYAIDASY